MAIASIRSTVGCACSRKGLIFRNFSEILPTGFVRSITNEILLPVLSLGKQRDNDGKIMHDHVNLVGLGRIFD